MREPTAGRIATKARRSEGVKALDLRHASALHADPRPAGQLSRRRLVVLLAASAGAPGRTGRLRWGMKPPAPGGGYKFPGAKKDETGNYKMRNI